ncbi:MAG TPA: M14 family zinc carboxypeptidase, partial [Ferruginibacter sp.]|nr:M14 family zinc carboxypeptidase [Ferruginibacter sp.]
MRVKTIFAGLLLMSMTATAQLKSPDEFLGYPLGSKFTPHYKIVNYFNQTVAAMPQLMKLEKYGETNEGRELLLAFVSSAENMTRLEEIRRNNLRLTGMLKDKPADLSAPAIVWLSFNVHGNEASSSEVSMKTLYELLNPANAQTKEWLKNTVVIIDPCLNPDGRDRYVNWFN